MNRRHRLAVFLVCAVVAMVALPSFGRQFFAAPEGRPDNPGSFSQPWSIDTAFRMPSWRLGSGDTVWIRGGRYQGTFVVEANGNTSKPLVFQAYPGERVVFDSYTGLNNKVFTLEIKGNYIWLVNVEVENTSPTRISNATNINSANDLHQSVGIQVLGNGSRIINCSIHDIPGLGLGYWSTALNAEIYGCFIYNNGISTIDRGHGPAVYAQNADETKPKAIRNCFLFGGFSTGIQFYSSASSDKLNGLIIDSSTIFNAGSLTRSNQARRKNLLAGAETNGATNQTPGVARASGLYIHNNTFFRDTTDNINPSFWRFFDFKENIELGFQNEALTDSFVSFRSNHVYGDPLPILLHSWDTGVFKHNYIVSYKSNNQGTRNLIQLTPNAQPFNNWDSNTYRTNEPAYNTPFSQMTFTKWKDSFNIDEHSSFINAPFTEHYSFARRNKYQPNVYYITVMNYAQLDSIIINYNFGEHHGMNYSLYDVQRSLQDPLMKGLFDGTLLSLPMKQTEVAPTLGLTPAAPRHTSAALGTFVLRFYPTITTIKSGLWNDPSTWNVGRAPTHEDDVVLQHNVTINGLAWCRSLQSGPHTVLAQPDAHLLISNGGN